VIEQVGHYQIERLLGEGTFAHVYRAVDQKLERAVALKLLKPFWLSDPQAIARFITEAKTMARLHHPHIVAVYDVDQAEGQVYMAQFLVEGETLAARLARRPIPWPQTLALLQGIAAALDAAHAQGIVHRDVKPQNILLDRADRPYLSDFGLVRAAEGSASISASASLAGTGHYIAPELWDNQPATPASDVYALSCVIYEMLSGNILFEGSSMMAVLKKHTDGPQLPAKWPAGVPAGLTAALKKGLAKDPTGRFSAAGELAAALSDLASNRATAPAQPQTGPEQAPAENRADRPTEAAVRPFNILRSALYGGISLILLYFALLLMAAPTANTIFGGISLPLMYVGIFGTLGGVLAASKISASGRNVIIGSVAWFISFIVLGLIGFGLGVIATIGIIASWAWVKLLNWLFHRGG